MLNEVIEEFEINIRFYKTIGMIVSLSLVPQLFYVSSLALFGIAFYGVFMILVARVSKIIFFLSVLYINILNMLLIHIKTHWGGGIVDRILLIMKSPRYEMIEYLSEHLAYDDYLFLFYSFSTIIFCIYFLINKKLKNTTKNKYIYLFLLVSISILQNQQPLNTIKTYLIEARLDNAIQDRSELIKKYKTNIKIKNERMAYTKVILIIGESANKNYCGLYNFDKNTTPFLSSLIEKEYFYKFNAIAPSNQTRYSVPMILTDANVQDYYARYIKSISIISEFETAGYKTNWISNQGSAGKHNNAIASIASEANNSFFLRDSNQLQSNKDYKIIEYLNNMHDSNKKEMFIFHLMGSHYKYSNRYDEVHRVHKNPISKEEEYENTIFYTDYILREIFSYFKNLNESFIIVYLSDHGEVVSEEKHGHGFRPTFQDEYDIPFIVYSSIKNKRLNELYERNKQHHINAESANIFIKYITGLSATGEVSYSSKVFSVTPDNVKNYEELEYYK